MKILSYAERASFNPYLVCFEGTRLHILLPIFTWMTEKGAKAHLMWLEGLLGSGKSFVAHSVAARAQELGILGSSFFMTPGTNIRDVEDQCSASKEPPSLKNLVTSLVVDLGGLSTAFKWTIGELLENQPRLATASPSVQLTDLLLPSLASLPKDRVFLWVIDGFDEIMRYHDRGESHRLFETLTSSLRSFPSNFIIFITSRPLPHHPVPQVPAVCHIRLDLSSPENHHDLNIISYAELQKLATTNQYFSIPTPGDQISLSFRKKAEGHPLWLRVVRDYLETSATPNEELEELLNSNDSSDYDQLMTSTYVQVVVRSIDLRNSKNQKALRIVVSVLLTLQRPLPLPTLLEILKGSTEIPARTFNSIATSLRSLLLGLDNERPLEFIHLSLRDFFVSSKSFGDLVQDVTMPRDLSPGHLTLLECAFQVMEIHLRPEVSVADYPRENAPLAYVVASWPNHMTQLDATAHGQQLSIPLSKFLDLSFIPWLEYHPTIGIPFLFTRKFLDHAQSLAQSLWVEKVVSQRKIASKLDELRGRFEKSRRFNDWALCSDQSVEFWRYQLTFRSDHRSLCIAINNMARGLDNLGQTREALAASEEAVSLYRQLFQDHPSVFEADLALSLNNFSVYLSYAGRHAETLAAIEQAVSLYRQLVQDRPNVFEADLARSLNNFSIHLSNAGRHAEARAAIEQAVSLYRQLVQDRPNVFEADLALSLNSFSVSLSDAGRHAEALAAIEQAVSLHLQLVQDRPNVFEADLARSLNSFSISLSDAGRHAEALAAIEQAVSLHLQLVQDRPNVFEADLARSLDSFSVSLSDAGRHAEALAAIEQAVLLRRQLVQDRPNVFEADLALSLNNFSNRLSNAGRHAEARAAIEQAVSLYRQLVQDRPNVFEADLARSLNNFSLHLSNAGRHAEARAAIEQAVLLRRQLVQDRPNVFEADLARSLDNFSNCLSDAGRHAEALVAIEHAVSLYRQLVQDRPNVFEGDLVRLLNNLSKRLSDVGRDAESATVKEEAALLERRRAAS
ncbi:hypothetical protein DL96DRAFT_1477604 [Flagelloscypha sp. PMI_526]|nr:hypothetical protein DL96DRAFT_1477604 [Flagelloscypha sp. PMI_526]